MVVPGNWPVLGGRPTWLYELAHQAIDAALNELGDIELIGAVPYDEALRDAEVARKSAIGASAAADKAIAGIVDRLESERD